MTGDVTGAATERPPAAPLGWEALARCRRVGCGFYLPPGTESAVIAVQERLGASRVRSTRPHVTLHATRAAAGSLSLRDALERWAAGVQPLDIRLEGVARAARTDRTVLFVTATPAAALRGLASAVRRLLDPGAAPLPPRYVPHLTLYDAPPGRRDAAIERLARSAWSPTGVRLGAISLAGEIDGRWHPLAHLPVAAAARRGAEPLSP